MLISPALLGLGVWARAGAELGKNHTTTLTVRRHAALQIQSATLLLPHSAQLTISAQLKNLKAQLVSLATKWHDYGARTTHPPNHPPTRLCFSWSLIMIFDPLEIVFTIPNKK